MITVITLNPSVDRTLYLSDFAPGTTNRAESVRVDAGGKGVNVCLHLKALGAKNVRCLGFMRDADAPMFHRVLEPAGIECRWLTMPGHVRTNTKVCTAAGGLTEINESGAPVDNAMIDRMLEEFSEACTDSSVIVLTGSIPPGVDKAIYRQMIEISHAHHIPCLLDADGDALKIAIKAKPDFIKPNLSEAEKLLNIRINDEPALYEAAASLINMGIPSGCISLGEQGAFYFSMKSLEKLPALPVSVRSTVGAGDAMIAAFALGFCEGIGENDSFRLAMAASAAAVCSEGTQPVNPKLVSELLKSIKS